MSQERIDQLAERVRNFNIAISGGSDLVGGFGPIPDKDVTLGHLEQAFNDFTLLGHNGLQAAGSIWTGYMLCCDGQAAGGETGGFPVPPPPPTTGACCADDGSCTITTEAECTGTYQGNGTVCDPNPCLPTGACCHDGNCTTETEDDCADLGGTFHLGEACDDPCKGACCDEIGGCTSVVEAVCDSEGGTFQGIGVPCDPNPCSVSCGDIDPTIHPIIQVGFSGITLDCDCNSIGSANYALVTDINVNQSFTATWDVGFGAWVSIDTVETCHVKNFLGASCSGDPESENDAKEYLSISCSDGLWHVRYGAANGNISLFESHSADISSSNEITDCDDPFFFVFGHGGDCSLTIL